MEIIIGIDDAGRGPVLGPMVLAGVLIEKEHEQKLKKWGVKDSKLLSAEERNEIGEKILNEHDNHFELAHVEEIDACGNLNWLEAKKAAMIINKLMENIRENVKVVVDCPSVNCRVWGGYLKNLLEKQELIELIVEHKADENHLAVGAASIVAKVTRDKEIEKIKKEFGFDCGSGYASDPVTQKFLEENLEMLKDIGIVRKSWNTWRKVVGKGEQKELF